MKKFAALLCLMSLTVIAQNSPQRPSWSQGLPERQKAPTAAPSELTIENETDDSQSKPVIDPFEAERPNLDIKIDNEPVAVAPIEDIQITPSVPVSNEEDVVRLDRRSRPGMLNREKRAENETVDASLLSQYQWQVVKTTPVYIPSEVKDIDTLNVIIHVRPSGRVSKVEAMDDSLSSRAMSQIADSIKEWRFEPPKNVGIDATISKPFEIDIRS